MQNTASDQSEVNRKNYTRRRIAAAEMESGSSESDFELCSLFDENESDGESIVPVVTEVTLQEAMGSLESHLARDDASDVSPSTRAVYDVVPELVRNGATSSKDHHVEVEQRPTMSFKEGPADYWEMPNHCVGNVVASSSDCIYQADKSPARRSLEKEPMESRPTSDDSSFRSYVDAEVADYPPPTENYAQHGQNEFIHSMEDACRYGTALGSAQPSMSMKSRDSRQLPESVSLNDAARGRGYCFQTHQHRRSGQEPKGFQHTPEESCVPTDAYAEEFCGPPLSNSGYYREEDDFHPGKEDVRRYVTTPSYAQCLAREQSINSQHLRKPLVNDGTASNSGYSNQADPGSMRRSFHRASRVSQSDLADFDSVSLARAEVGYPQLTDECMDRGCHGRGDSMHPHPTHPSHRRTYRDAVEQRSYDQRYHGGMNYDFSHGAHPCQRTYGHPLYTSCDPPFHPQHPGPYTEFDEASAYYGDFGGGDPWPQSGRGRGLKMGAGRGGNDRPMPYGPAVGFGQGMGRGSRPLPSFRRRPREDLEEAEWRRARVGGAITRNALDRFDEQRLLDGMKPKVVELRAVLDKIDLLLYRPDFQTFTGVKVQVEMVRNQIQALIGVLEKPELIERSRNALEEMHESAFDMKNLNFWLHQKDKEVNHFVNLFRAVGVQSMIKNHSEFQSAIAKANPASPLLVLAMGKCLRDNSQFHQALEHSLKTMEFNSFQFEESEWYDDDYFIHTLSSQIKKFIDFASANQGFLTSSVVTCDVPELRKCHPGTILLYCDDKPCIFFPPPSVDMPQVEDCSDTTIKICWKEPADTKSIEGYVVYYRLACDDDTNWKTASIMRSTSCVIDNLLEDSEYIFKIAAVTKAGKGVASELSEKIRTRPPPPLALKMLPFCTTISEPTDGLPGWYQLPLTESYHDSANRLRRFEVGEQHPAKRENKVLLLVGATGAGKTTLINGLINFLYGVKYEDGFRLVLVQDETQLSQAHSQTMYITAYTLNWHPGAALPYSLTIVDTPGYGDTQGIENDRKITKQIKDFFDMKGPNGITHLDGIGFVAQAPLARLTEAQKYVFDSILSVFGKDVGDNICLMVTFADGRPPPLLEAVKAHNLPYKSYYKFNSSVFSQGKGVVDSSKSQGGSGDNQGEDFDRMFWSLAISSFKSFFSDFKVMEAKSLVLTREVLEERHRLEVTVEGFQDRITRGVNQLSRMRQELELVQHFKAEKKANKKFKRVIEVPKTRRVNYTERNRYVTNCLICNVTCHTHCGIPEDEGKHGCWAMNGAGENAQCRICVNSCSWRQHVNRPYYFEEYVEKEEVTLEDLQKKYMDAAGKLADKKQLLERMMEEYNAIQLGVLTDIENVRNCIEKLDRIAMKPNPLTAVDYIDMLIKSTEHEKRAGWERRLEQLRKARERAIMIERMRKEGKAYDPFKALRVEFAKFNSENVSKSLFEVIKSFFGY